MSMREIFQSYGERAEEIFKIMTKKDQVFFNDFISSLLNAGIYAMQEAHLETKLKRDHLKVVRQ